jgi:hypothetical protein
LEIQRPVDETKSLNQRREFVAQHCQQALKSGCALPDIFGAAEKALIPGLIQPQWVSEAALRNLEQMGLGEKAVLRILDMLLNGMIAFPTLPLSSGAVAAALELSCPTPLQSAEDLAGRILCLYEQNERLLKLRAPAWLVLLDRCATATLPQEPETLSRFLGKYITAQYIVILGLGLPLLKMTKTILPLSLPGWNLRAVEYALTSARTDSFDPALTGGNLSRPLEKIDVIDSLIFERRLSFADMLKLAQAEVGPALMNAFRKLDPTRPLVIFGDHGFRLAPDGQSFSHGGNSTLERITPAFVLYPSA